MIEKSDDKFLKQNNREKSDDKFLKKIIIEKNQMTSF